MKNKQKLMLLSLLLLFSITFNIFANILGGLNSDNSKRNTNLIFILEKKYDNLKDSMSWNLTSSPIFIDDSDLNYNWSKTSAENDWCSGSGTWNDPYIVENVTIIGPSIQNSIEIRNSNLPFEIRNCNLTSTNVVNWVNGIMLDNVSNGLIIKNTCSFKFNFGVYLIGSTNNNFFRNKISNSPVAITVTGFNNIFSENIMEGCGFHLRASDSYDYSGIYNEISSHTIDSSNLVNSKPVYYYISQNFLHNENVSNTGQVILVDCFNGSFTNLNLSDSSYGIYIFGGGNNTISNCLLRNIRTESIYLHFSNNNTILDNRITNSNIGIRGSSSHSNNISLNHIDYCSNGISLDNCNFNNISQSTLNHNYQGIELRYSTENIFENNQIKYNTHYGMVLYYGVDNNIIKRNLIQFNKDYGIYFINTAENRDNLIYYNYFVANGQHAYDIGINTKWDNGTIGNYWDDYTGIDLNGDGIGDAPHDFGTGFDFFPIYREAPKITIFAPKDNQIFQNTPYFIIEVSGLDLDTIWYTLSLAEKKYLINANTTIDESTWESLPNGNVKISFFANDTYGIFSSEEVVIIKSTENAPYINIMPIVIVIGVLSCLGIIIWKRKFFGKVLFVNDPEKIKIVKKKLLDLGTQFEQLNINEIAESCGVLERTVISILKDMIKNNEIYASFDKNRNLVIFDQHLITEEIDQLMETYRKWEKKEFGKKSEKS